MNPDAVEWFNKVDNNGELVLSKEQWTLAYDGFYRFGNGTSNMAETYNSFILGARGLPLKSLVKKIFYNCVLYWDKRRVEATEEMAKGKVFTPYAKERIAFTLVRGVSFSITSSLALSTSIQFLEILCPNTMPFCTMK